MNLQDFHQLLEGIVGVQHEEAEIEFNELLQTDPALLLELIVSSIQQFRDKTVKSAMVLLKRSAVLLDKDFLTIGDEEFHNSFQNSLLSLIVLPIQDITLIPILSDDISCFASIYQQQWPNLSISLLELIFNPEVGIVAPLPSSPLSTTIATDIIWRCINNESIILEQDEIIDCIVNIIDIILQYPFSVNIHQFISTVRLAFAAYPKLIAKQLNIILYATPIVEVIPQLPSNIIEEYLGVISLFAESNILFFFPDIENFITILVTLINESEQISNLSRCRCVSILTSIIIYDKYYQIILPKSFELYQLFLSIIYNCTLPFDSESGIQKTNIIEVTEDAIQQLAEYFSESIEFPNDVSVMFTECLENDADLDYVISNLIGFSSAVKCEASYMYSNSINSADKIFPIYQATVLNDDSRLRYIAVKSLNSVMKNFGKDWYDFDADDFIQMIAEALSNETEEVILTQLIKSMKIYVTHFSDFIPYCDAIMELLESKFEQMKENQQILVLEVYLRISESLKSDFLQYMQPVYELIETVLTNFDSENQNYPFDLFFKCMEIGPKFSCLPKGEFDSMANIILTFISSIPNLDDLSSGQMDSINGALCAILKRNPSHFIPFAPEIVNLVLEQANTEITFFSFEPDFESNDDYKYGDDISFFNPKTNMVEVYDISSINTIIEALNTLSILLINIDKIVAEIEDFCGNLVGTIQKIFTQNRISNVINIKLFKVINNFFLAVKKNEMLNLVFEEETEAEIDGEIQSKPIVFLFYQQQVKAVSTVINLINDLQKFSNMTGLIAELRKSFIFICKVFVQIQSDPSGLFSETLSSTLDLIVSIYNKTIYVRQFAGNITDCGDDFNYIDDVESIVGSLFGVIFSTMAPLIDQESFQSLSEETFSIQPQNLREGEKLFLSSIVFDFWQFFILLHPGCTREQAQSVVATFRDMSADDQISNETSRCAISAAVHIVCGLEDHDDDGDDDDSNRYGFDELIEPTVSFLNALCDSGYDRPSNFNYVDKELIIMAQRCVRNNWDPSQPLQLLVNFMPIIFIWKDNFYGDSEYDQNDDVVFDNFLCCYNLRAAQCLIKLAHNQKVEILQSIDGAITVVALALLLFKNMKSDDIKRDLKNLVQSYLNDQDISEQVLESLHQLYDGTFFNVNKALNEMRNA